MIDHHSQMQPRKPYAGFSLVEVLVTVIVIGVGLLGMASLHATGIKHNQNAYLRSQANILAADMLDRMRSNTALARDGSYNLAMSATAPTGTAIQDIDRTEWLGLLASILPSGDGAVSCSGTGCAVAVRWDDRRAAAGDLLTGVADFDGDGTNDNDADGDGIPDRALLVLRTRL